MPELLLGLAVIAIAFVVTGFVVADAIRDVKQSRDTIRVTGIGAPPDHGQSRHLAPGRGRKGRTAPGSDAPATKRTAAVRDFLREGGIPDSAITPPPSDVSDYGINDTSSREKDVTAVVSVTFSVR